MDFHYTSLPIEKEGAFTAKISASYLKVDVAREPLLVPAP